MALNTFQSAFNGGELSPEALSRIDIERYGAGCKIIENFIVLPVGGVKRRDGWRHIAQTKFPDKKSRLIPYSTGIGRSFMLEFGDFYFRIFQNGIAIDDGIGPNLVPDPDFQVDVSNWTDLSVGGVFQHIPLLEAAHLKNALSGDVSYMEIELVTEIGVSYAFVTEVSGAGTHVLEARVGTASGTNDILSQTIGAGEHLLVFVATGIATFIGLRLTGLSDNEGREFIQNENFDEGLAIWDNLSTPPGDVVANVVLGESVAEVLRNDQAGGVGLLSQEVDLFFPAAPHNFRVLFQEERAQSTALRFRIGSAQGLADILDQILVENGLITQVFQVTPGVSPVFVEFIGPEPIGRGFFVHELSLKQAGFGMAIERVDVHALGVIEERVTPWGEDDLDALNYAQFDTFLSIVSPVSPIHKIIAGTPVGWQIIEEDFVASRQIEGALGTIIGDFGARPEAAYDGNAFQALAAAAATAAGQNIGFSGKDWGVDNERALKGVKIFSSTDAGFWTNEEPEIEIQVQGSNDNFVADIQVLADTAIQDKSNTLIEVEIFNLNDTRTKFRYHRIRIEAKSGSANQLIVGEIEFFEAVSQNPPGLNDVLGEFPEAVGSFQQRQVVGGQEARPMTVYGSRVGEFFDLDLGDALDDDAFEHQLTALSQIQWFTEDSDLLIGTNHGIIRMTGGNDPLTANNRLARPDVKIGADPARPEQMGNATLYIQSDRKRVVEILFDLNLAKLSPNDLSQLADHIAKKTGGGFKGMAPQVQPNKIMWFFKEDGEMTGLTYDRAEKVVGWHRHPVDNGKVEWMASVTRDDGVGIDVYGIVNRTIEGQTRRFVELLQEDIFVDSAVIYSSTGFPATTLEGYDHLEGETVQVNGDGANLGEFIVLNGQVVLPEGIAVIEAHGGLGFLPRLQPVPPVRGSGFKRRFAKTKVKLRDTLTLTINGRQQFFRIGSDIMGIAPPEFTGNHRVPSLGWDEDPVVEFSGPGPLPITVLSYWGELITGEIS